MKPCFLEGWTYGTCKGLYGPDPKSPGKHIVKDLEGRFSISVFSAVVRIREGQYPEGNPVFFYE